jgi:hypothetical protein
LFFDVRLFMPWKIRRSIPEEERLTEDQMARRELGPRGVPGGPDTTAMTPQRKEKTPQSGEFDGHPA